MAWYTDHASSGPTRGVWHGTLIRWSYKGVWHGILIRWSYKGCMAWYTDHASSGHTRGVWHGTLIMLAVVIQGVYSMGH